MPRIYLIEETATGRKRLVNANSQGQALLFCAKTQYQIKPALAVDVAAAYEAGIKVEEAKESTANGEGEPK